MPACCLICGKSFTHLPTSAIWSVWICMIFYMHPIESVSPYVLEWMLESSVCSFRKYSTYNNLFKSERKEQLYAPPPCYHFWKSTFYPAEYPIQPGGPHDQLPVTSFGIKKVGFPHTCLGLFIAEWLFTRLLLTLHISWVTEVTQSSPLMFYNTREPIINSLVK